MNLVPKNRKGFVKTSLIRRLYPRESNPARDFLSLLIAAFLIETLMLSGRHTIFRDLSFVRTQTHDVFSAFIKFRGFRAFVASKDDSVVCGKIIFSCPS